MTTLATIEPKSSEWLREYRETIGGSSAAAVIGKSRYMTPADLYDRMTGATPDEDLSDNPDIRRGQLFEPLALDLLGRELGCEITPHDQSQFLRSGHYWFAHILPDGKADDGVYVEAKVPRPANVSSAVLNGVPDEWHIQCQHGMAVTQQEKWHLVLLDVVNVQIARFMVTRDEELIKRLMDAELEFMSRVTSGNRPDEESIVDVGDIETVGGEMTVVQGEAAERAALHYFRMQELVKEAEEVRDVARERLVAISADAEMFRVPGIGKFYHKPTKPRRTFDADKAKRDFPQLKDDKYMKVSKPSRPFKAYPDKGN